jgi:hypothetical protein
MPLVINDSDIITEPEKYPSHINCTLTLKNKAIWGKINEK